MRADRYEGRVCDLSHNDVCWVFGVVQTVAHARMEQQLYGSSSRSREDDSRVISGKSRSLAGRPTGRGGGNTHHTRG